MEIYKDGTEIAEFKFIKEDIDPNTTYYYLKNTITN